MSEENVEIVRRAFERWRQGEATIDSLPRELLAVGAAGETPAT